MTQSQTHSHLTPRQTTPDNPLDLLIVGAGISGIDLAHHVAKNFPQWSWAIVDSNSDVGGTWNTFTYPGIRSDSDMATFSFPFERWPHQGTLGSGARIKEHVRDAAADCGALERLTLSTWVRHSNFNTESGLWEVEVVEGPAHTNNAEGSVRGVSEEDEGYTVYTRRLHFAAGYYKHSAGFTAAIPGLDNFAGTVIHPQRWPENVDVRGKNIIIIGSGATAVTLLPALHAMGAHTTMLQRTPTYIAPLPETDVISTITGAVVGKKGRRGQLAGRIARTGHIFRDMAQYHLCQAFPTISRGAFWAMNRAFVNGDEIRRNFTPPYGPWDQRVCKSPGGDFFRALQKGAKVVTGVIDTVEASGIRLTDTSFLPADIIITATGLQLQAFGNATFSVDDADVPTRSMVAYRSMMANRIPNFSYTIGYLNQSWTLRADMTSRYLVQLWKDMDKRGELYACPVLPEDLNANRPMLEMKSGYIRRSVDDLPRQAARDPWRMEHDYVKERRTFLGSDNTLDMAFGADALAAAAPLAAGAGGGGAEKLVMPA
ncbi:NAD(P)/FAD-dependent oxidoreductase [uncultured Corynebacterium sp.]|uniref:flavin-containing monooxygenase n=1 Tax=uncultured Corynebacterium sp. TaxID=159447 RepID=UPI0025D1057B|nr:NAD(P)/FAD-dependent oxidoreductase [uncultured Corynebacterium sp.]